MKPKTHVVVTVMTYLLAALSAAAGIPKILQMPQELEFLQFIGFSEIAVSLLGIFQLAGGVLLLFRKTRLSGAILATAALLISSIAIFFSGNIPFGVISLLPVAISICVVYVTVKQVERIAA